MSVELVHGADGTLWVIDGEPGAYVARQVGPPVTFDWARKYELRAAIRNGDIIGEPWTIDVDTKGRL